MSAWATPETVTQQRLADFETLPEALDYAAQGSARLRFNTPNGNAQDVSYAQLRSEAMALAGRFAFEFDRGAHIGLVAETSPAFVIAFMACQYAGLVAAPVSLPPAIGGSEAYCDQVERIRRAASLETLLVPASLRPVFDRMALPGNHRLLPMDADAWQDHPVAPLRPWGRDGACYIQFSSGSTSEPKGICATQASVTANCRAITRHGLEVRPGDHAVSWLPLYHDMGLVGFFIAPLMAQLPVDYLSTSDFARRPMSWLRLISETRATLSYSPSFGYELCRRRHRGEVFDLSSWRAAGIGGDMIRHDVLEEFASSFAASGFSPDAFVASYGLAEATLAVAFAPLGGGVCTDAVDATALRFEDQVRPASPHAHAKGAVRRFVLCGKPAEGHEVRIRSRRGGSLPDRQIGQIQVRGPSIAAGYYRASSGLKALTNAQGWMDTGDLGYWLDGQIVVTGRWKDLIIWNGRNIWPQDVEWAVQEAASGNVDRCAVIDMSDEESGDHIVLFAECREKREVQREAIRRALAHAARVSTGAPVDVILLPPRSLPVTSSGKLSRAATRRQFRGLSREPAQPSA